MGEARVGGGGRFAGKLEGVGPATYGRAIGSSWVGCGGRGIGRFRGGMRPVRALATGPQGPPWGPGGRGRLLVVDVGTLGADCVRTSIAVLRGGC